MDELPRGVWPVMLTPFTESSAIDWEGLRALTEWYVDAGVAGLFPVSLSSEMHHLRPDERLRMAERTVDYADGRVPVVATGTFGGPVEEQARFVAEMAETGVDTVVVNVARLAERWESDREWEAALSRLLEATDDAALGLYECPEPYHRLLSTEALVSAAETDRFLFFKDTCCRPDLLAERIQAVAETPLGVYNANVPTLLSSLRAGAAGYSGTAANFVPDLLAWLCDNYDDRPETAEKLQRFLTLADYVIRTAYPASAKRFLADEVGVTTVCRTDGGSLAAEDLRALEDLCASADAWRADLGLR